MTTARGSMSRIALQRGRWLALQSVALQLLSVVTTAILTRLLSPSDFGFLAVTTVLVGLFSLINAVGINASVIRRDVVNERVVSTFFWLALMLGAAASGALMLLARPLSASFGQVESAPLVVALAPVLLLNLVRSVPLAVLTRDLKFGSVAIVGVIDFVAYAGSAIAIAATFDIGAWSVIIGRLLGAVLSLAAVGIIGRVRIRRVLDWAVVREDIAFNAGVLGSGLISFASRNLDYWAVGQLGARSLGLYYIAYVLPNVLRRRLTMVGTEIFFPILSRMADDRERLGRGFLMATRFMALIGFPTMFGLAVVADGLVPLLFGARYGEVAEPTSIIAIASGIGVLFATTGPVFLADGVPHWSAFVGIVRLVTISIGLAIAVAMGGLVPVAYAVLASSVAGLTVSIGLVLRRLPLRVTDVMTTVFPAVVSSGVMVGVVLGAKRVLGESALAWPGMILVIAIGVVAYAGFGLVVYRSAFITLFKNLRTALTSSSSQKNRAGLLDDHV